MSKNNKQSLQVLLQNFFLKRMIQQRNLSNQTISTYRDTFRIYLKYLLHAFNIKASHADISHFNREYLFGFVEYLANERGNKPTTMLASV